MDIPSVFPDKVTVFGGWTVSTTLIAAFGTTLAIDVYKRQIYTGGRKGPEGEHTERRIGGLPCSRTEMYAL